MGLDTARYHGWHGKLRSPVWSSLALVRVALLQVFRRKIYWLVLALGFLRFVVFYVTIYMVTQFTELPPVFREFAFRALDFKASSELGDSGYIRFMDGQSVVVMILLAFSGSLLVGADFRLGSLPFYLSRRIDRWHYILGKLLAVSVLVSLVTVVPALVLFIEYGAFTSSFEYWLDNFDVALSIVGYGAVIAGSLSILLVTISAYLERMAPIAVVWSSLFILLGSISRLLDRITGYEAWELLNPWRLIRHTGRLWFPAFRQSEDAWLGWWSLFILTVVCTALLLALFRRVRAVEVVE